MKCINVLMKIKYPQSVLGRALKMAGLNNSALFCFLNEFFTKKDFEMLERVSNIQDNSSDYTMLSLKPVLNDIEDNKTVVCKNVQTFLVQSVDVGSEVIVTLFIVLLICVELSLPYHRFHVIDIINKKTLKRCAALLILTAIFPLLILALLMCLLYKSICKSIIIRTDKLFVNYLDSFDVFWSLDDDSSKSIINVLGVVEANSANELVDQIKKKLLNAEPNIATDKIFYRRHEKFGFYYWRKCEIVDIDQYIKVLDHKGKTKYLNDTEIEEIMELVNKEMLPYNDEGLFQILVVSPRLYDIVDAKDYAIIFRIHHAVGDGVALLKFLCKTLANDKDCAVKIFPDSYVSSVTKSTPKALMSMIKTLCEVPLCFIDGIIRESDDNILHGPKLSGNKIFKWTDVDEKILGKIKIIKNTVNGVTFTDVLMAALATSLHNFFREKSSCSPDELAVVLPVRFAQAAKREDDFKLDNNFSVTILDLPIIDGGLREIQLRCNKIRKSADPITNYYFLKLVGAVLPKPLLRRLLNSSQATLIFSNMPGPDTFDICEGNKLKKLVFFVPHKGSTGLGITALSYGGVLRLGAIADAALISNSEDLGLILNGMEQEIRRLHQEVIDGRF